MGNLGKRIQFLREGQGWTRKELAQRAGFSIGYIKEIEKGKRKASKTTTLKQIADALKVPFDALLIEDEVPKMEDLSGRDFLITNLKGIFQGELKSQPTTPELWILLGDEADARKEWNLALQYYNAALNLIPKDYRWARWSVERVAPIHMYQGEFSKANAVFSEVLDVIKEWGDNSVNHELIIGAIFAEQGCIENYRGRSNHAVKQIVKAIEIAKQWDDARIESRSRHLLGRSIIESQSPLFYFAAFGLHEPELRSLNLGLSEILRSKELNHSRKDEYAVGFDLLWEGLGLHLYGQYYDSRKILQQSADILRGDTAHAYPIVEIQRINSLDAGYSKWPGREYDEIGESLSEWLWTLSFQPHPFAYVRALTAYLCVKILAAHYRRDPIERKRCVDLCVISLLLHNEPEHTFYKASKELLFRFVQAMKDSELADYIYDLPFRISTYSEDFAVLKKHTTLTNASITNVTDWIVDVCQKQDRKIG